VKTAKQSNDGADVAVERSAIRKASWRILPLLGLGYLVAFVDRANISFAATQMNGDLHFTATIYGLGAGLFFLSYALFEVPSNLLLMRFGARRWIARIMITWGLLAMAMMFVRTPVQFCILRFLLGFAEAGFFPGVVYYMAHWFPMAQRGRAVSRFYVSGPISAIVMGMVSGSLLKLDGLGGLRGWHWLFLLEGFPAVVVGFLILMLLPDAPASSPWLNSEEKGWLQEALAADQARLGDPEHHNVLGAMRNPVVLQLGVLGAFVIGSFYALNLSAPTLLMAATGWNIVRVGYLTSVAGVLGVAGMLFTGFLSDKLGSRFGVLIASTLLMATGSAVVAFAASPATVITGYLMFMLAWTTVTNSMVLLWADLLPLKSLAVGCAAINSMNFIGGFAGPYLWGWAKDATGTYTLALSVMCGSLLTAAAMVVALRANTKRRQAIAIARMSV
jgi:ACS family tartrate transporter-like MFS transporter